MEGDQEQRHSCKVCRKSFPNGRSLGGHMRSHLSLNSSFDVDEGENSKKTWRLRENPKKTWRLSDSGDDDFLKSYRLCDVCGKGFPSSKSLYGHMKCHRERSYSTLEKDEEEEEGSWNYGAQKMGSESQSDSEVTAVVVPKRKRRRRSRRVAAIAGSSSSVSESEKEREDGALSLMMLSRDVKISVTESSDKNSVVLEDKVIPEEGSELGASGNGYQGKELKKVGSDVSVCGFVMDDEFDDFDGASRKRTSKNINLNCNVTELGKTAMDYVCDAEVGIYTSPKKGQYECTTCNKIFHSYQALGGHRASHKRNEAYFTSMEANSQIKSAAMEEATGQKLGGKTLDGLSKKSKSYKCPVCPKVFSSGQALGGHKRSHLASSSETIVQQLRMPESIDLNLPATVGEDSNHGGSEATTSLSNFWI